MLCAMTVECVPTAASIRQSEGIEFPKLSIKYTLKTTSKGKKEQMRCASLRMLFGDKCAVDRAISPV
jgi:hypothetical protein